MTNDAGPATDAREFCGQDLLVLTDAQRDGRNALTLPFRHATVLALLSDAKEVCIEGHFDTIAVDRTSFDLHWLKAVIRRALPALRPSGRVLVVLDASGDAEPARATTDEPTLANLRWHGLAALNGQPCAVLAVNDRSDSAYATTAVLESAVIAGRIAAEGAAYDNTRLMLDHSNKSCEQDLEARWRSEKALLWHLNHLAEQLEQQRRQHQGVALVRIVLRRSKPGRAMLRAVRPCRRFARALIARLRPPAASPR